MDTRPNLATERDSTSSPSISTFSQSMEAKPHTPVYVMHKYFARRPWNVFNELISHYTSPGDIVLDPFCGGGVTVVESLKLGRKAIGVDLNPLATYVTEMECRPLDIARFKESLFELSKAVQPAILRLYRTKCAKCDSDAIADWIEWDEAHGRILQLKYDCPKCGSSSRKKPSTRDARIAKEIDEDFTRYIKDDKLWYPETRIPNGDKTGALLGRGIRFFHELFTKRNLLALSILFNAISSLEDEQAQSFLRLAFSSSLKWASRQSHLRGKIVEGWAMHAYWIYPRSLEINVWNTFRRRTQAVLRGKTFSNHDLDEKLRLATTFQEITENKASCLILNHTSTELPLPADCVDAIITDPPYGGNVNYAELSDYWFIWMSNGQTIDRASEVIINRTQQKKLVDYESLLSAVLAECYRVLKPERYFVSTFNSNDMRVVGSFMIAASKAGFKLNPRGLIYQKPIRSYTTTFHAMQIGAFVGDFIFTFVKEKTARSDAVDATKNKSKLKATLGQLVARAVQHGTMEPDLREQAYKLLIPFLNEHARTDSDICRETAGFFESEIRKHERHFVEARRKITDQRKTRFRQRG